MDNERKCPNCGHVLTANQAAALGDIYAIHFVCEACWKTRFERTKNPPDSVKNGKWQNWLTTE